jgi:hypothetical protein
VKRRSAALVVLVAAVGVGLAAFGAGGNAQEPEPESFEAPLHVLFIGNSLTYWNDLPAVFTAMAVAAGKPRPFVRAVTGPGWSLEDQWDRGEAQKAIAVGGWDYVVLQQGPSASADGVAVLSAYARRFAEPIRSAGARPVLYMVWPSTSRSQDFDGVARSYSGVAKEVGGLLCPAGDAWREAWKLQPGLALYSSDGLHPTPAGTYLAALTFFGILYGNSPAGLPATLSLSSDAKLEVPEAEARTMQEAAARALAARKPK